jgi:AcrR family transcriptional regulator
VVPSALVERRAGGASGEQPADAESRLDVCLATGQRRTIVDAALRCIARYGISKTTLDDVAREASCSRATIYRMFPGGKDALGETLLETEVARLFEAISRRLDGVTEIEELLVAAMDEAVKQIGGHGALQFMLAHEPDMVLPRIAFSQSPWLADEDARRVGEWVTRVVISYLVCPPAAAGSRDGSRFPDEAYLRHLVQSFVLPGIRALQSSSDR